MDADQLMKVVKEKYGAGDLRGALGFALQAHDLMPEWPLYGHAAHAIATIYGDLGLWQQAVRWWAIFVDEMDSRPYPQLKTAKAYCNWGYSLRQLERYDEAIGKYRVALPALKAEGRLVARCSQNLAWALCLQGKYDEAEKALLEATDYLKDDDDRRHQELGLAYVYADTGRGEQAERMCESVLAGSADESVREQAEMILGIVRKAG